MDVSMLGFAAVFIADSRGRRLRWISAVLINTPCRAIPLRTLAANRFSGLTRGGNMGRFERFYLLSPHLRLLAMNGIGHNMATFTKLSVEADTPLLRSQPSRMDGHTASPLIGILGNASLWSIPGSHRFETLTGCAS